MLLPKASVEITAGRHDESLLREVHRNLTTLYGTRVGEQALDRDFGIDYNPVDMPMESARALTAAEYVRKTQKYEPRARVLRVEWPKGNFADGEMPVKVVVELAE